MSRMIDRIRDAWRMRPFQPFWIKLSDGMEYPVPHPEMIAVPPGEDPGEVIVFTEGSDPNDHGTHWLNTDQMIAVMRRGHSVPSGTGEGG